MVDNVFPFILDKLSSQQTATKMECLDVLKEMAEKFRHDSSDMRQHLEVTVSSIQNEYFNRFEHDIQIKTKHALSSILTLIESKKSYQH